MGRRKRRQHRVKASGLDVLITQATYQIRRPDPSVNEAEYPEVQLYGVTKEGKSIVLTTTQFSPYFYAEDLPKADRFLSHNEFVRKVEHVTMDGTGGPRRVLKVFTDLPMHVGWLRKTLEKDLEVTCWAADILFGLRFMIDQRVGAFVHVEGSYDYDDNHYIMTDIKPGKPFKPDLVIMSFDMEVSKDDHIVCICTRTKIGNDEISESFWDESGDDGNIIRRFTEYVKGIDPDIITGHYIIKYDLDVLQKRAELFGVPLRLGRDGSKLRAYYDDDGTPNKWICNGRLIVDTHALTKQEKYYGSQGRFTQSTYEDLDTVAFELGWEGPAKQIDATKVDEIWKEDPELVLEYCATDAEKALFIFDGFEALEKALALAVISPNPLERLFTPMTSWLWDPLLIQAADEDDWLVPCNKYGKKKKDEEEKISGAFVVEPVAGLHDWTCSLDFKSQYPSAIIGNNICFTTHTSRTSGTTASPHLEKCDTTAYFLKPKEREGIIPRILKDLGKQRDHAKKMYEKTGDMYWERLNRAIKVVMNAIYGLLASSFYRFTNQEIGESITTFARETMLKPTLAKVEEMGIEIVYGDTDSFYVLAPVKRAMDAVKWGQKLAGELSEGLAELDLERVFRRFFNHGRKKRYAGTVVWPEEYVYVRGYELRRGDSFPYQRSVLQGLLDSILAGDPEGGCMGARAKVRTLSEGSVGNDELVIIKSCKAFTEYVNPDRMANVKAVRKLKKLGYPWVPGHKVAWVVTNGKTPQEVEPYVEGEHDDMLPDYEYYTRRILDMISFHNKKPGIVEAFGFDRTTMEEGHRPSTLEEWFE